MFYKLKSIVFKSTIGWLLAIIIIMACFGKFIAVEIYQVLYAISLSIKSIIICLLPLIIFGLLFRTVIKLAHNATKIIGLILVGVCCSNFLAVCLSHVIGIWVYNFNLSILVPHNNAGLEPAFVLELPKFIANDQAMFAGILLGIFGNFFNKFNNKFNKNFIIKLSVDLEMLINKILKYFTYLIPLFIAGFVAKLQYDGVVSMIIKDYFLIFIVIAVVQFSYILCLYFILNNYNFKKLLVSIKNMLPAAISGFSTMSSAASMPLTIIGVENNTKSKDLAASVVPLTVNIHLIGDCLAIPILAYAVLKNYSMVEPSLVSYMIFAFYFVVAKFSVAAVPGGGIIVMLPILEAYLGFNAQMLSLITALYILFDPVITCINILGNGAFAKMIDRVLNIK